MSTTLERDLVAQLTPSTLTGSTARPESQITAPVDTVPSLAAVPEPAADEVEMWGHASFPASDPPANW